MTQTQAGLLVLRLGLAAVFLWFGFSQLTDGGYWVAWVPLWATALTNLSPETIVLMNGSFEAALGALLVLGLWVRPVAAVLALHLAVITVGIGFTEIGVRDFGLTMATLALVFLGRGTD